jgi:copper chaperone CopZ
LEELMERAHTSQIIIIALVLMAFLAGSVYAGDGCPSSKKAKAESSCTKSTTTSTAGASTGSKACCPKSSGKACTPEEKKACGSKLAVSGAVSQLTLGVAYLTCNGCASQVSNALKQVTGVQSVAVDYKSGIADVEFDTKAVTSAELVSAIEKAGYHAQVGPYSEAELSEFAKGGKPGV